MVELRQRVRDEHLLEKSGNVRRESQTVVRLPSCDCRWLSVDTHGQVHIVVADKVEVRNGECQEMSRNKRSWFEESCDEVFSCTFHPDRHVGESAVASMMFDLQLKTCSES